MKESYVRAEWSHENGYILEASSLHEPLPTNPSAVNVKLYTSRRSFCARRLVRGTFPSKTQTPT